MIDHTHDPALQSWVPAANGHAAFPIQNLPVGVFSTEGGEGRAGVAIGDHILDLRAAGLYPYEGRGQDLTAMLADPDQRQAIRLAASALLARGAPARTELLYPADDCTMHLPARIGDYTDFFAGIHHATASGRLFRPDQPLLANYKYVPIAYHGRASSIGVGNRVRRPNGQRKPASETVPSFGPSRNLDYELELGIWVGPGNALGTSVPIDRAGQHIGGYCLLNDWSARDIQGWEYQPLGPFLAKSFCTTISPWIVTPEALAPFRIPQAPRPDGDPAPLGYLLDAADQACGAIDIAFEVLLATPSMRAKDLPPARLSISYARDLYWTPAQMLAHHTGNGCNLRPGDLFGSGTISSPGADGSGCLLEMTGGGRQPLSLPNGESRRFLEDGDEVIFRGTARREGFASIGFGECRGVVLPAE